MSKHINEIVFSYFLIFFQFMQHVYAMLLVSHSFKCVFSDIHILALIVKTQENTGKCTILQFKVFTIEALEIGYVSTPSSGSSTGSVHQYLCRT